MATARNSSLVWSTGWSTFGDRFVPPLFLQDETLFSVVLPAYLFHFAQNGQQLPKVHLTLVFLDQMRVPSLPPHYSKLPELAQNCHFLAHHLAHRFRGPARETVLHARLTQRLTARVTSHFRSSLP